MGSPPCPLTAPSPPDSVPGPVDAALPSSGPVLWPFEDPVAELPLLGRSFEAARRREIELSGVDPSRVQLAENLFLSAPLLARWAREASSGPSRLELGPDHPSVPLLAGSRAERTPDGGISLDARLDAPYASTRAEDVLPHRLSGPAPARPPLDLAARLEEPAVPTSEIAAQIDAWFHLLWLAPALVPLELTRSKARRRSGALFPNVIGKRARIHPRAHVEGSILGDDVSIGEGAAVIDSYVGSGSTLADFARVRRSVIGEGAHLLADARFSDVVSLGRGSLANLGLCSTLLGRDVFLTSAVIFEHASEEPISAMVEGRELETGRRVLGGCVGHGAVLGTRTILMPGRVLPSGATVVMRREEGVQRIPALPDGAELMWENATLVPYSGG